MNNKISNILLFCFSLAFFLALSFAGPVPTRQASAASETVYVWASLDPPIINSRTCDTADNPLCEGAVSTEFRQYSNLVYDPGSNKEVLIDGTHCIINNNFSSTNCRSITLTKDGDTYISAEYYDPTDTGFAGTEPPAPVLITVLTPPELEGQTPDVPTAEEAAAAAGEDEKEIVLQCKAFGTGWIVCPLVEALASIGDGIIKNLIVPFLQSTPIDLENGESSLFKVWSTFRIIANIILVAALLFVVFGNAIGSGPAEAYLAKRSLPRIFIAAILINTSIYIAAAMVDITNILGKGIGQLLMAPFAGNGAFVFDIGAGAVTATTLLTLTSVAGAAVTVLAFQALVPFLALFVFIPAVIAMLATFMTLAIRQGILIFLIISAPVAFALFTLPNTAKYFSKWWGLFLKTLLVYPLIMVMIALANILAVMVNEANPSAIGAKTIKDLVSIILMLIPVFLVPFAFKMAGGIVSQAYNLINGTGRKGLEWYKGDAHNPYSNQSRIKRDATSAVIKERANAIKKLAPYTSSASNRNFLTRGLAKGATNVLGLGNIHRDRATTNKTSAEIVKELVDAGNEDVVRALFAERYDGTGEAKGRKIGHIYGRIPLASGVYKEYTESKFYQAQQIVGKDLSLLQAFATHEFNKSYDDDDQKAYRDSLAAVANRMGLTKPELQGVWAGIKFKNKATRLEEKYRGISGDAGSLQFNDYIDARGFTEEFAEVIRQWDYHNFRPSTIKALRASMNEAEAQIAHFDKATAKYSPEQYQAIKANIDTIMGEVRSQLVWEIPESNEANAQIAERYSTPVGSARVDEEWRVMYDEWRAHNGNAVEELTPKFRERT